MALADDAMKLEVVGDLPPGTRNRFRASEATAKIRQFVTDAAGKWCLVQEKACDKPRSLQTQFLIDLKRRLGSGYDVATRVEGVVVQAFARLKPDAA